MTLLIIGSTGTLGRQVVRKALDEGFQVKCFVRNFKKAAFLKEWGAELIYGDLKVPETIPMTLYGVTAIIDASAFRSGDLHLMSTIEVTSKKILIQSAKIAKVKRFIFFSVLNAQNYPEISMMYSKNQIEHELRVSGIDYTIFAFWGFFQGLIQQYAVPILDQKSVWITQENQAIPYIDTQDVAKITIRSLSINKTINMKFLLTGNTSWTSSEIIALCEKLSGQKSKISRVPLTVLRFLQIFTKMFQWSWSISERLAFTNVLIDKQVPETLSCNLYETFRININELNSLENYFQEYFFSILKKDERA
uniref:NmrA-like domain-containing protein n=1 Tax=Neogoniolithon spectabile TaxID=231755 RepID=A0A3G3MGY7_9FLOR|nr:hypothetical protein [Neogoniolithon spectabile]AYR06087.1 hypothetical protein [Neogoniolithon spectabile]